jgi:hypothetical protein
MLYIRENLSEGPLNVSSATSALHIYTVAIEFETP